MNSRQRRLKNRRLQRIVDCLVNYAVTTKEFQDEFERKLQNLIVYGNPDFEFRGCQCGESQFAKIQYDSK